MLTFSNILPDLNSGNAGEYNINYEYTNNFSLFSHGRFLIVMP